MNKRIVTGGRPLWHRFDIGILVGTAIVSGLLTQLLWSTTWAAPAEQRDGEIGFIVVAPDRGFQGNEEIRDAFEPFAARHNAALVVVTDERTRATLAEAVSRLAQRDIRRIVVLPYFLSRHDPRFVRVETLLTERAWQQTASATVTLARPFGESYFAVEALADRLYVLPDASGRRVIVVGDGADTPETMTRMEADWRRLAQSAAEGLPFKSVHALVWNSAATPDLDARRRELQAALTQAAAGGKRVTLVPFHLGRKLDSMMTFTNELKQLAPAGAELVPDEPQPAISTWLEHEANRYLPLAPRNIGVVILAHGSDYHWNETLRAAVRLLEQHYLVEYCFSMADPPLIERSIRRLEQRGARAAVIVRVFGLADSFADDVARLFGLDIEPGHTPPAHVMPAHHVHGDDHAGAPRRIRTALLVRSVGGLDDHPLFARALLERALSLSKDPARETVILTAHGAGDDARNQRWLDVLESLARKIRAGEGKAFRAIRVATWREDWPEKRAPWIAKVRQMVADAAGDGGSALVIPARTNAQGPERKFLKGLEFALGTGFAPHPLFAQWVDEQIKNGSASIQRDREALLAAANVAGN